jgi:hypothetical protein
VWIQLLGIGPDAESHKRGNETSGSIRGWELFEQMNDYHFLKNESFPWSNYFRRVVVSVNNPEEGTVGRPVTATISHFDNSYARELDI